jgi:acyl-CoA dehydrogenase
VTHLVHGAIGFTREYALHHHTLAMLHWRNDLQAILGGETVCARELGNVAISQGGVWQAVTSLMGRAST